MILNIIRNFKFPIITKKDLISKSNLSRWIIEEEIKKLLKINMISREKRRGMQTVFLTRKGLGNLLKWEKEGDQV